MENSSIQQALMTFSFVNNLCKISLSYIDPVEVKFIVKCCHNMQKQIVQVKIITPASLHISMLQTR